MNRVTTFTLDHRRPLAAAFAALAVLAGVRAVQPSDETVPVLVADRDLDSGHVLTAADLRTTRTARDSRPHHVVSRASAVGRRVSAPMRAGEAITDRRVIDPRDLSGFGEDSALTMVRLADPTALAGVRVGDLVDVVATVPGERARVVAADAALAVVPRTDDDSTSVGVVTGSDASLDLASASLDAELTVVVTR